MMQLGLQKLEQYLKVFQLILLNLVNLHTIVQHKDRWIITFLPVVQILDMHNLGQIHNRHIALDFDQLLVLVRNHHFLICQQLF